MSIQSAARTLPYSCEQLFDVAADVESYPDYLPGWVRARILERCGNRVRVEQQLGLKPLTLPFVTTAVFDRPQNISIHSDDGPFRFLQIDWSFEPAEPGLCTVRLELRYRLRGIFRARLAAALFERLSAEVIDRFEQRAHRLCGRPAT